MTVLRRFDAEEAADDGFTATLEEAEA